MAWAGVETRRSAVDGPVRHAGEERACGVRISGGRRLRDLPWRATRDPWAVLVAEVMLQQTQAVRAIPAWRAFLTAHPTPAACAASPLGAVLRQWHGLGYPRRARNLHDAVQLIVADHGGRVPGSLDALLTLPGIGPYTARAVLAFAFECDMAVVDTNIARLLARTCGRRLTGRQVQALADELVPSGAGWVWNQSLMDLGATVCRPAPQCGDCPVADRCAWHVAGHPLPDPAAGSAGVSTRQAPYAGSDRQRRGAIMAALSKSTGPVPAESFPVEIVDTLVADRLVVRAGEMLRLP